MSTSAPSFDFRTLGCRLNQAEEALFAGQFVALGWHRAAPGEKPDVLVLHSCAVTHTAERETFQHLRSLRRARGASPTPLLVVAGCAVSCNPASAFLEAGADLLVPRQDQPRLAELVAARLGQVPPVPAAPVRPLFHTSRALLKVQDGCGFGCAYCIVPLTRGPATSRPLGDVLAEAEAILAQGYLELVVTGCNLACYRDDARGLPELVDALCRLAAEKGARVRLGSVEPAICDDALRDVMLARPNFCRFLHLPIQSGDTALLRAMGRHYTAGEIESILERLFASIPLLSVGSDFIAGLPGEDEEAFEHTCDLVRRFPFSQAHVFPYSPRQGTRAVDFPNRPSRAVARDRAARLRAIVATSAARYREQWIGRPSRVLLEKRGEDGFAYGWNEARISCRVEAPADVPIPSFADFTATAAHGATLVGGRGDSPPPPCRL